MGVTLAEAEVATRIRQKYLSALEADEWDLLPGEVVGRGFLRNYTTYLGMDATEMIERRRAVADDSLAAVLVNTSAGSALPPERKVDYRPKDVALHDESEELEAPRQLNLTPLLTILALVVLGVFLWWGVTRLGPQVGDLAASAQKQVAAWQQQLTAAPTPTVAAAAALPENQVAAPPADSRSPFQLAPVGKQPQPSSRPYLRLWIRLLAAPVSAAAPETVLAPTPVPVEPTPEAAVSLLAILPSPTPQVEIPTPAPLAQRPTPRPTSAAVPAPTIPSAAAPPRVRQSSLVGQSADGAWYQLEGGTAWIFALLVDNPPANLPVVEAPPLPPPAEVAPAAGGTPVEQPAAAATQP